jgi:GNAT superfamily N-acetyltransferase
MRGNATVGAMTVATQNHAAGTLPAALVWQSLSFLRCEWPFLFGGDNRLRARPFGGPADSHLTRTDGEVLLSYADVVRAEATVGGRPVEVRGLSNVFTFPPYRGEGHASAILDAARQLIETSDAHVGILFCEPELETFYSDHGWQRAPAGTIVVPTDPPVAMVRECSPRGGEIIASLGSVPLNLPYAW